MSEQVLQGQVALLSGAARGIGLGCAQALARMGPTIILNDRPGSSDLPAVVEQFRQAGVTCEGIEADAVTREGCEYLVQRTIELAGRIDLLVSNVASPVRVSFLDSTPGQFERTIAGTLTNGFHLAQLAARQMVQQGTGGKLLFISSVQAGMYLAGTCAYGAAKAGLNHLVKTLAVELACHRINVNAIEPGWIDTPGERQVFSEETIRDEGSRLPWGRLGTPGDIGAAAGFLLSPAADYITGTILTVDGGFRLKDFLPQKVIPTASTNQDS